MKKGFLRVVRKALLPAALVASMAALSPVSAFAAEHGGFGGREGGHGYSAPARGFQGRGFEGHGYYGGGGYRNYGRGYYGPGFGLGIGVYAPYGYAAPVCNPAGYYNQFGVWQPYPGCAVPYGY